MENTAHSSRTRIWGIETLLIIVLEVEYEKWTLLIIPELEYEV